MTHGPGWKMMNLLLPRAWYPLIDRAKGDITRCEWIRDVIRDALREAKVWPGDEEKEAQK